MRKQMLEHKQRVGHKVTLKMLAEVDKECIPNVHEKTPAQEKKNTSKVFQAAYKEVK
jgi:hypothetical protein